MALDETKKKNSSRFLGGFLAALVGMGCAIVSTSQAADPIEAYLDSSGRVVFVNQARVAPTPRKAASSASQSRTADSPNLSSKLGRPSLDRVIQQSASRHQVDPDLVRAIVRVESNFDPYAVSLRGAQGLMQLIPATAQRFGVRDAFDPRANLEGGVR